MSFRAARIDAGLSVIEVAKRMRVSDAAVYMWETGKTMPNTKRLGQLAALYGTTVDRLISHNPADQEEKEVTK